MALCRLFISIFGQLGTDGLRKYVFVIFQFSCLFFLKTTNIFKMEFFVEAFYGPLVVTIALVELTRVERSFSEL